MVKVRDKILQDTKKRIEETKKKIDDTRKKINSIEYDAHWYRRVFHAFGACLLFYYLLPNEDWVNVLKFWVPPLMVIAILVVEFLRLKGFVSSDHFFGLRMYEQKRIGSYVFFAIAFLILIRFFPQQIAIPCILCACLSDPIMGEIRHRFGKRHVYVFGFLVSMIFFMVAWYKADIRLMIFASVIGATGAVIGETKKFWWLDDDFMIQMLPAVLLLIVWIAMSHLGLSHPDPVIYPSVWPW
jgi:dolichol kinase